MGDKVLEDGTGGALSGVIERLISKISSFIQIRTIDTM